MCPVTKVLGKLFQVLFPMGAESNAALFLAIVIGVLCGILVWRIFISKDDVHEHRRGIDRCLGLSWCKKGKDCKPGEVCYKNACIPRKVCTTDQDCTPSQEVCYNTTGVLSYCVPKDECTTDSDCQKGDKCVSGTCTSS